MVNVLPEHKHRTALARIARLRAELGDFNEAQKIAQELPEEDRAWTIPSIAVAQSEQGDAKGASKLYLESGFETTTTSGLGMIVSQQAWSGDPAGAIQAAEQINDPAERALAFAYISRSIAFQQKNLKRAEMLMERAISVIREVPDDVRKAVVLLELGTVFVESEKYVEAQAALLEALKLAREAPEDRKGFHEARSSVIAKIGAALRRAGDVSGAQSAFETARSLATEDPFLDMRINSLASIARHQVQSKDVDGALETARSQKTGFREPIFLVIAVEQAHSGDVSGALATSANLEEPFARAWVFAEIGRMQGRGDKPSEAKSSLAIAQQYTASIRGKTCRAALAKAIGVYQAEISDFGSAMATANKLEDWTERVEVLESIAQQQALKGNLGAALEWIEKLESRELKVISLISAVDGHISYLRSAAKGYGLPEVWNTQYPPTNCSMS
jgi:tetratricopeptide (TPR) repeat protein